MLSRAVTSADHYYANARWLLKLRRVAVIGQIAVILGSMWLFQTQIPMAWAMGVVIALTLASNMFLTRWFDRWRVIDQQNRDEWVDDSRLPWNLVLGLVLIMDMLSLTALLFTSGGPNNPFCLFFFVNLSLSALLLNRQWAWAINGLTVVCFGILLIQHFELETLDMGLGRVRRMDDITLQHMGYLVAFTTCSSVIVYFMNRLTEELRAQQIQIRRAQELQANSEKIEALGTLAAGTAHELATPLSTIAIVARDVEQAFEEHPPNFPGGEEVVEDVHLIRSQLDRCRRIIDRMSSHAGETIGESIEATSIQHITDMILEGIMDQDRVQVKLPAELADRIVRVPRDALTQAMRGLVQNAIDADTSGQPVDVIVKQQLSSWTWIIRDRGPGMSPEHLKRISEPFFTTKAPGKGMGLGVFLAKNVIGRLGGSVEFESKSGTGTTATVTLPNNQ